MFNKTKNALKNAVRNWLNLTEANGLIVDINELFDFDGNAFVNEIWYRGDGYELEQLYKAVPDYKYSFWGAACTKGLEIRKIHTGLPKIIVNTLKSPIATKEITITKPKDIYFVDIVAYGRLDQKQCNTLKDCFDYIREYFNMKKGQ